MLISCNHMVCFSPPMFVLAHMRAALEDIMGMHNCVGLSSAPSWTVPCLVYTFMCAVRAGSCWQGVFQPHS